MAADTWQPVKTGNALLDQSLIELAQRLTGMDAVIASLAVPGVVQATRSFTITDETYVEWRGGAGVITLPDAAYRGKGRGSLITIQNFGTATVTVRAFARNAVNGAAEIEIEVDSGGLFSGNGVSKWSALKPGGGHVIRNGVVEFPDRGALNFSDDFVVSDDPANDETDVDINFPDESLFPYSSSIYYAPGVTNSYDGQLTTSVATAQDFLTAIPHLFKVAGTIDFMAQHFSGQGGTTHDVYHAIYRDAGGIPGTRVFDHQYTSATIGNFAGAKHETAVNVSVSAGEIMWFASVHRVNNNPQQLAVAARVLPPVLGTEYTGPAGTNPPRAFAVGYRVAFSYAQPPSTWSGTTLMLAGTTDIPCPLFKFTPS